VLIGAVQARVMPVLAPNHLLLICRSMDGVRIAGSKYQANMEAELWWSRKWFFFTYALVDIFL
jgi:hypothetical protein